MTGKRSEGFNEDMANIRKIPGRMAKDTDGFMPTVADEKDVSNFLMRGAAKIPLGPHRDLLILKIKGWKNYDIARKYGVTTEIVDRMEKEAVDKVMQVLG